MLNEVPQQTKYVVKIQGQVLTPPLATSQLAESFIATLSPDKQALAEIVPTTSDGKQILFG